MIWHAVDKFHPPHGRVDGVIYYGGLGVAQPILPVGWDGLGTELVWWNEATSTWDLATIADGQLSVNVVLAPAGVLPALDGTALTGVVHQQPQGSVNGLDAAGHLSITLVNPVLLAAMVACWYGTAGVGQVVVTNIGGGVWDIDSSAGVLDAFLVVAWLAL